MSSIKGSFGRKAKTPRSKHTYRGARRNYARDKSNAKVGFRMLWEALRERVTIHNGGFAGVVRPNKRDRSKDGIVYSVGGGNHGA